MQQVLLHSNEVLELSKELRLMTIGNVDQQQAIYRAAAADPSVFLMAGGWTKVIKEVNIDGVELPAQVATQPFIPWDAQRDALTEIVWCVENGRDIAWAKSRDIGATWLVLGVSLWGWLFHEWSSLLCSRNEDCVDRAGDLDALFPRIDVLTSMLPSIFLPCPVADLQPNGKRRRHMILEHPKGHSIAGSATTAHIGRSGRRTFILFDEAAAQDKLEAGWRSATDTTSTKIALSTHLQGSYFTRKLWPEALQENTAIVSILTTYELHPTKSMGGEWRIDVDGSITGDVGRKYLWTPWLQGQMARRDMIDMRENVFALPSTAGKGFFPLAHIVRLRSAQFKPRRCEVIEGKLIDSRAGRWRIFREPTMHSKLVVAADPSYGTGAANTVASMFDVDRVEMIAVFVDPHCPPYELAQELVVAGKGWAKGRSDLLMGWETNGPGGSMEKDFIRLNWAAVYEDTPNKPGWTSSKIEKRRLYGDLARVMADNMIIIPDQETLDECEDTIVYDTGSIGPARLEIDVSSGAREAHGDRVVGCALGYRMVSNAAGTPDRPTEDPGIPDQRARSVMNMEGLLPEQFKDQ